MREAWDRMHLQVTKREKREMHGQSFTELGDQKKREKQRRENKLRVYPLVKKEMKKNKWIEDCNEVITRCKTHCDKMRNAKMS